MALFLYNYEVHPPKKKRNCGGEGLCCWLAQRIPAMWHSEALQCMVGVRHATRPDLGLELQYLILMKQFGIRNGFELNIMKVIVYQYYPILVTDLYNQI